VDAQHTLRLAYREGKGVPQDDREAARLFRRAANKGHADAQCELEACYRLGKGMPQDDDEAARLYRRAADQGHTLGQFNCGKCHDQEKGVPQDYREAARSYGLATEQGLLKPRATSRFSTKMAGACRRMLARLRASTASQPSRAWPVHNST